MAKTLKWIAIAVVVLLVLAIGGAWLATRLVSPAQVKAAISSVVADRTHGRLAIGGDLSWAFLPQIALTAGDAAYTRDGAGKPMAKIGLLKLGVDFWPLLHGQVNVGQVTLSGLELDLVRDKAGHGNWENLLVERAQPTPQKPARPAGALVLAIAKVAIDHTSIHYTDLATGTRQALDDVTLAGKSINIDGQPFPLTFSFTAQSSDPAITARVDASTTAALDAANSKADLDDTTITVATSGAATGGKTVTARLTFSAHADLAAGRAEIPDLHLTAADLDANARLNVTGLATSPAGTGSITIKSFSPRKLAAAIGAELPQLTDPKALTDASLSAGFGYDQQALTVRDLLLKLDDSTVRGNIGLATSGKTPALQADLAIDQLDLDRYRTKAADPAGDDTAAAKPAVPAGTPLIPLPLVRGVNTSMRLEVGKLTAARLPFENVALQIRSRDDVIHVNDLRATLFDAPLTASGQLDARAETAQLAARAQVDKLPLKPVLRAVGDTDWIEGALTLSADLKASGNTIDAIERHANGTVTFAIVQPVLRGMNLEHQVCQAIAAINGEQLSAQWGPDTPMKTIRGDVTIKNGIAHNNSLTGGLDNMDLRGHGTIDPLAGRLDYRIGVRVDSAEAQKDPACRVNKRYQTIYWPLRCRGDFDTKPAKLCGIDRDELNKIIAELAAKELQRKAGDKLQDLLQQWMK